MENSMEAVSNLITLLKRMSANEIDRYIESGVITVHEGYIGHSTFESVDLPGGWQIRTTHPPFEDSESVLYICPVEPRTFPIWKKGQIDRAIKAGLTKEQAARWIASSYPRRHAQLDYITQIIQDKKTIHAYLCYQWVSNHAQAIRWRHENKIRDNLGYMNRHRLVKHLIEVLGRDHEYITSFVHVY